MYSVNDVSKTVPVGVSIFSFKWWHILKRRYNEIRLIIIINLSGDNMVTGYCVKCKEKGVELSAPEIYQTAKGGFMAKGKHEKCGTTVCAMMSKDNAEKALENGATKAY